MDINNVLRRIKMQLGIGRGIPVSTSDADLVDVIHIITLPDFCRYFKNDIRINNFRFMPEDRVPNSRNMYMIPDTFREELRSQGIKIDGVKEIKASRYYDTDNDWGGGIIADPNPGLMGNDGIFGGMMVNAMGYHATNEVFESSKRAWFRAPHFIEFAIDYISPENYLYDMTLWTSHPDNMSSIPDGYMASFLKLAMMDVKIFLWNNEFFALDGTETGRGTIKVPQWGGVEQERAEYIKELADLMIMEEAIIFDIAD